MYNVKNTSYQLYIDIYDCYKNVLFNIIKYLFKTYNNKI